MVVIAVLGWFVGVQPQLDAASSASAQRADVEATNAKNRAALAKLKSDSASLDDMKAQLAALGQSVPTDAQMPALVNELDALAAQAGVTISGLTVSDAQPYKSVAPPASSTSGTTSADATATPAPTDAPVPAAAETPAAGMPPVTNALITADNFAAIPIQVTVTGQYANVLNFVKGVQTGKRLFLVTTFSTTEAKASGAIELPPGSVDANLAGLTYVLTSTAAPVPASTATQSNAAAG